MTNKLRNLINGEWIETTTEKYTPVINPGTQEILAECPDSNPTDTNRAVKAASEAYVEWRQTPVMSRTRYLMTFKNLLEEKFEEISKLVVKEAGKTLDEARGEVRRGLESIEFAFSVPSLMTGFKVEDISSGIDETAECQPLGVFAMLAPFNFPFLVPMWFLPVAIACGNTMVVKPSPTTPLSMDYVFKLWEEVELPEGVVNLVQGGVDAANTLMDHPEVKGVSFVGSSTIGKIIYERSSKSGKRVQIQGGAKNYLAVMPDAKLKTAVPNIMGSIYGCAGQRCLAGSVVLAVGDIYNSLKEELIIAANKLKVGYGLDEASQMGAIVTNKSKERILGMIEKGIEEGAELVLDGRNLVVPGYENGSFLGPSIFDKVTPNMTIAQEEIFGPVMSIMHVPDFETAIKSINTSRYGNAASIFTQNGGHAREFKYRINAGNIGINVGVAAATASFPFGGKKDSFFGDLHGQGPDSIRFFTDYKVVIERWI
ncbi:MAG: CoA-acylating methylmalonate-semialdehyde dehydrogenase [Candidatus Hodarchaeales archaeon]|jgi:malonate-semialdehyde dehydrogenase (acetylating)/methylmalonate-semialdehyde dehydrogenase